MKTKIPLSNSTHAYYSAHFAHSGIWPLRTGPRQPNHIQDSASMFLQKQVTGKWALIAFREEVDELFQNMPDFEPFRT